MRAGKYLLVAAGVAVAAVAAPYLVLGREPRALDDAARAAAKGRFVHLSRGYVHYDEAGPADGQPVVLVSGLTLPYAHWDETAHALAAAGLRPIEYDLYGRGLSDRPEATYDGELFDGELRELCDALSPGRPVDVVASSFGAFIAGEFTRRHPERVRRLALIDPAGMPGPVPAWMQRAVTPYFGPWYVRVFGPGLLTGAVGKYVARPEHVAALEGSLRDEMQYDGFQRALISTLRFGPNDGRAALEEVSRQKREVLIFWGKEDKVFPVARAEEFRRLMPAAQVQLVDGAGHLAHVDRPDVVNPALVEFLRR